MRERWNGDSLLGWTVIALLFAGGPARGQDGSAAELDYDRGHLAAREIVAFGHAITGDLIEPHAHGRRVCYEPHVADVPPLKITYIDDYHTAPTHPVDRYRHAHHHGNVVQEHAHHYASDHDHRPGSELDYLAAYERYQRTERSDEFDEYSFVVDRFERKVPTYRIHGTAPSKPQQHTEPEQFEAHQRDVTLTEELEAQDAPVEAAGNDGPDDEAEGDAPELEDAVDAYAEESSPEVIQTGTEIIIGDDPRHRDRMVDDYRRERRDDRHDFDKQTHNRLDPSKNRRHIKGGDNRRGDKGRADKNASAPNLSERIQANNADLGARIDSRALGQGTRLDQRLVDATR